MRKGRSADRSPLSDDPDMDVQETPRQRSRRRKLARASGASATILAVLLGGVWLARKPIADSFIAQTLSDSVEDSSSGLLGGLSPELLLVFSRHAGKLPTFHLTMRLANYMLSPRLQDVHLNAEFESLGNVP